MDKNDYEKLIEELKALEKEHAELNQLLDNEEKIALLDQLSLLRTKKRKLWLKDKIHHIKQQLYPDIIA
jgi:hypothetical protein